MKYKLNVKIAILLIGIFALQACNKWVDITPKDRMTDKMLFSTKEGYLKALNGIYAELNNPTLYGRDLTMGLLDVMAQYYNTGIADHGQQRYALFDYPSTEFKGKLDGIWSRLYTLIANANVVLERTDERPEILPGVYYGMVKGEALALRAMFHFDLLRMYGPIYQLDKAKESIPYMIGTDREVQPLLSAEEVLSNVIRDLEEAQALLRDNDPVLTLGPQNFAGSENNDLVYRQYKLNYFAVTALLARAHLWGGNTNEALEYAQEVISKGQVEGAEFFPFVTLNEIRPSVENVPPDRVFSKEVLFAAYNSSRFNSFNALFSGSLSPTSLLTFPGSLIEGRVALLYDNQNDYRRGMWNSRVANETEVIYWTKYEDVTSTNGNAEAFRYMLPLIRISEMYFIVAECADNLQVAGAALNRLRLHRGVHEIEFNHMDDIERTIESEYIKEFQGEGQLFYFFKRKAYMELPDGNRAAGGVIPMQLENYVFPLPENETSQRVL